MAAPAFSIAPPNQLINSASQLPIPSSKAGNRKRVPDRISSNSSRNAHRAPGTCFSTWSLYEYSVPASHNAPGLSSGRSLLRTAPVLPAAEAPSTPPSPYPLVLGWYIPVRTFPPRPLLARRSRPLLPPPARHLSNNKSLQPSSISSLLPYNFSHSYQQLLLSAQATARPKLTSPHSLTTPSHFGHSLSNALRLSSIVRLFYHFVAASILSAPTNPLALPFPIQ